jgi:HYDIN/CFA65/VesB-like, Ig-like domain
MTRKAYGTKKGAKQTQKSSLPLYLAGGALILIIVGVFVLLRGSSTPSKAIEVTGKPKLAVDQEKVDLGKQPLGKTVSVAFELSNVGDKPLQLQGIPKVEVKEGC